MTFFAHCARTVCSFVVLCSAATAFAADISFTVRDQFGKPLADAVIELENNANSPSTQLPIAIMDQVDKQFSPNVLVIQQGQSVDFPNSDNIRHHVYSFSSAKPFNIKLYADRPEKPELFDNSGVVVLGCNIHDSMVGYIYVANSANTLKTAEDGKVQLKGITVPTSITIWHPNQASEINKKLSVTVTEQVADITINTNEPAPRNTFGEMFKADNDS
ncbi:methylamine utilization protein [Pseudoalteromonas sp. B5MOD-1]|uniref:methylamine utilization protein n=1 Tax=Pseudoalteromonas TaxID=53246 RepID=UPI00078514B8|nr:MULTISPECIES: methylamine utilization protein [Pseudoalteromonas]KZY45217.1 plastocyanin [Pseudoalteromonas shioyasakiensis]MCO7207833.1 methylamine utilization protein [Pseudoalteromonas sp. CnMc7-37]MCZ4250365.1 methylamine utilization protein [Pseudoalteromonas shioyasakiensis]RZF88714.1 methylamine utilization protein [Pseudoalteromonas sp. CO109Y]TMO38019.1 methylamine utilization protein [Pseudoalteromonas sp. S4491]